MDSSEIYNEEKLVQWLSVNLPILRKLDDGFKIKPRKAEA